MEGNLPGTLYIAPPLRQNIPKSCTTSEKSRGATISDGEVKVPFVRSTNHQEGNEILQTL